MQRRSLSAAWRRWQRAAGPWVGWAICPCLTVDGGSASKPSAGAASVDGMLEVFEPGNTAVVLDLDAVVGVALAAEISRQGLGYVVLVLPRWPHELAVLETNGLTAALTANAARLATKPDDDTNVVFVLDGLRRVPLRDRATKDPRVDNRYDLSAADLPKLATLRQAGIQRVVKISASA